MFYRCLLLLLLFPLLLGCGNTTPKQQATKKSPAASKTKAKSAAASKPERVVEQRSGPPPIQRITVVGEAGPRPVEIPNASNIKPRTEKQKAAGYMRYDADIYTNETVKFSRYKMRRDIEEFNRIAADMIKKKKYSTDITGPISAAWMNLNNRKNEAAAAHPNVSGLNNVQRELKAAVAAYEKCLTEVYNPLRKEIEAHRSENVAPIAALEQAIKDGSAALEAWDKRLNDALDAWKKNGQAEIEAAVK